MTRSDEKRAIVSQVKSNYPYLCIYVCLSICVPACPSVSVLSRPSQQC